MLCSLWNVKSGSVGRERCLNLFSVESFWFQRNKQDLPVKADANKCLSLKKKSAF